MKAIQLGLVIVFTTVTGMQVVVSEENEAILVKADPLEVEVLDSALFDMSAIGASSVNLRLDKIKGQRQLQMVARWGKLKISLDHRSLAFASKSSKSRHSLCFLRISSVGSGPLFSTPSCLPSIHLVTLLSLM